MDYTSLQTFEDKRDHVARNYPTVRDVQLPSLGQFFKEDLIYPLTAGLIFGIGHFIGAFVMKKKFG